MARYLEAFLVVEANVDSLAESGHRSSGTHRTVRKVCGPLITSSGCTG